MVHSWLTARHPPHLGPPPGHPSQCPQAGRSNVPHGQEIGVRVVLHIANGVDRSSVQHLDKLRRETEIAKRSFAPIRMGADGLLLLLDNPASETISTGVDVQGDQAAESLGFGT